jgi:hypothetical protein
MFRGIREKIQSNEHGGSFSIYPRQTTVTDVLTTVHGPFATDCCVDKSSEERPSER